jgi:hypothetical protein
VVSFRLSILLGYDTVYFGKEFPFTVVVCPDSTIIDNYLYAVQYLMDPRVQLNFGHSNIHFVSVP